MPVHEIHHLYQAGEEEYVIPDNTWYVRLIYWFLRRKGLIKQKPKVEARLNRHKNIEDEIMKQINELHACFQRPASILIGHKQEIELLSIVNDLPTLNFTHRNTDGSGFKDVISFQGLEVHVCNWFDGIMVLPDFALKPKKFHIPDHKDYYRELYKGKPNE